MLWLRSSPSMKRFIRTSANIMVEFYQASCFETAWVKSGRQSQPVYRSAFLLTTGVNVGKIDLANLMSALPLTADVDQTWSELSFIVRSGHWCLPQQLISGGKNGVVSYENGITDRARWIRDCVAQRGIEHNGGQQTKRGRPSAS